MTATNVKRAASLGVVAVATTLGVLALPWIMPVHVRAIDSLSQAVGFSNRTAVISALVGAVLLALIAYLTRKAPAEPFVSAAKAEEGNARIGWPVLALAATGSAAWVLGAGALLGGRAVLDGIYFVDRMLYVVNGNVPYAQFEFSYGPLMLYPQTWLYLLLRHVGVNASWTNYIWLAAAQALGVVLAGYVINRLAIASRWTKIVLLLALVIVDAPLLALNQSLLRFVLPYALLLGVLGFARRHGFRAVAAGLALASVALAALVSPEQGIALGIGVFAAFAIPAWRGAPGSRVALGVLAVGGLAIAAVVSRAPMLAWTASGTYNLPILPGTPELVFLAALFVVAVGVGSELQLADLDGAPVLVGWFAVALVLVSGAFGRADGMHIFLMSFGLTLGAVAIASRRRGALVWIVLGALAFGIVTYSWSLNHSSVQHFRPVAQQNNGPEIARLAQSLSDVAFLSVLRGPLGEGLAQRRAVVPTYGWHEYDANEAQRVLAEASGAQYLIVPTVMYRKYVKVKPPARGYAMKPPGTWDSTNWIRALYGVPLRIQLRYPALDGPRSLFPALLTQFTFEQQFGDLTLLKHR